ncbi:MAG: stringent starvation protein A [Gammaproteobacteria bacterium]|nr:stringent starvation protein A [Gammaproteobacteria bacterium]
MAVVANKKSVMTMYSDPRSPYSHRVRMVLAEKSISVEIVDSDPMDLSDDIMDLNPYGTLPTLVDRDLVLFESRIIMEYLDERFPHPPLLPVDPVSRATSRLFMHRVDRDWYSLMEQIFKGGKAASRARKELRETLTASAPIFAAKPFFMSSEFTLVDCSIAPLLWRLPSLGVDLPSQAKPVEEYARRMFDRPCFTQGITEFERDMRE